MSGAAPQSTDALARFSAIREWDIDLLLLEELSCSQRFCKWLIEQVATQAVRIADFDFQGTNGQARHSVSYAGDGSGESDLEAVFNGQYQQRRAKLLFLIEDKVDARFMDQQPERYQRRCAELHKANGYDLSATLLVAPRAYLEHSGTTCFCAKIAYEEIAEFLSQKHYASEEESILRRQHRVHMLNHAIERYRRGGQRINDETRTNLFDDYFRAAQQRHPQLCQTPPRSRSPQSKGFFYELYPRIRIRELLMEHKLDRGIVCIEFRGWGNHRDWYLPRIRQILNDPRMQADAPPDRQFVRVRIEGLPRLNLNQPFEEQLGLAIPGMDVAATLLAWYQLNQPRFEQWTAELDASL